MFKKILVPVDLAHVDALSRALSVAAELARSHGAEVVFVGVFGGLPSTAASSPNNYKAKLQTFADEQAQAEGIKASAAPIFSHDPEVELGSALLAAVTNTGADVVVMASHVPGWTEHVFHSNAGYMACHAAVSVFVVR